MSESDELTYVLPTVAPTYQDFNLKTVDIYDASEWSKFQMPLQLGTIGTFEVSGTDVEINVCRTNVTSTGVKFIPVMKADRDIYKLCKFI